MDVDCVLCGCLSLHSLACAWAPILCSLTIEEIAESLQHHPPEPVLPKDQLQLAADLRQEKKRTPAGKDKRDFLVKIHKRKGKDEKVFLTYAIYDTVAQKQIVQLTESTKDDAGSIIESTVQSLNEGTMTREDAVAAISAYKGIAPTS